MLGLRTLCLAVSDINPRFYNEWNQQYQIASTSVDNRQQLVEQAAECIEKVCFSVFWAIINCVLSVKNSILPMWIRLCSCLSLLVCLSAQLLRTFWTFVNVLEGISLGIRNNWLNSLSSRVRNFLLPWQVTSVAMNQTFSGEMDSVTWMSKISVAWWWTCRPFLCFISIKIPLFMWHVMQWEKTRIGNLSMG